MLLLWIIGLALLACGTYCVLFNAVVAFRRFSSGERSMSVIPFVGGTLASLGLLMIPALKWKWALIPLVVDVGCLPMIAMWAVYWLRTRVSHTS
jgi:hypothetical protein